MRLRILTAVVGLPILLLVVWAGGYWFTGLVALVAALAAWELAQIVRAWGQSPVPIVVAPLAALVTAPWTTSGLFYDSAIVTSIASLFAILAAIAMLPNRTGSGSRAATLPTPAIVLYAGTTLFHATGLSVLDEGRDWILLLLAITFSTASANVGTPSSRRRAARGSPPERATLRLASASSRVGQRYEPVASEAERAGLATDHEPLNPTPRA